MVSKKVILLRKTDAMTPRWEGAASRFPESHVLLEKASPQQVETCCRRASDAP